MNKETKINTQPYMSTQRFTVDTRFEYYGRENKIRQWRKNVIQFSHCLQNNDTYNKLKPEILRIQGCTREYINNNPRKVIYLFEVEGVNCNKSMTNVQKLNFNTVQIQKDYSHIITTLESKNINVNPIIHKALFGKGLD